MLLWLTMESVRDVMLEMHRGQRALLRIARVEDHEVSLVTLGDVALYNLEGNRTQREGEGRASAKGTAHRSAVARCTHHPAIVLLSGARRVTGHARDEDRLAHDARTVPHLVRGAHGREGRRAARSDRGRSSRR